MTTSQRIQSPPSSLTPWHWWWAAALAILVVVTFAFRMAMPVKDGDLWFHMLYGKYFLEHGTLIPDHTIFSWTPASNATIYCTWLPDIFLYLLYQAFGLTGIFAFRYACVFSLLAGCFFYARKHNVLTHPLTWLLCLLAMLMSFAAAVEKPEALSFLFMTLQVWNWWHIRSQGEKAWRNCYLFPLIMLVWVNSHGAFVFGMAFLFWAGLGEALNTWLSPHNALTPRLRKHLFIALILTVLSIFCTPYGYHYPVQLFFDFLPTKSNAEYHQFIGAYTSPFDRPDFFLLKLAANTGLSLLIFLYVRNFKKIEWSSLLSNFFFAFLYGKFYRTTFFWAPVILFSSLYMLSLVPIISSRWKKAVFFTRLFPLVVSVLMLLIVGKTLYKSYYFPERGQWMGFGISYGTPVDEVEYIKQYFPHSRIGNTYDEGAYLLWRLWPENKVFVDARHFPYREWSKEVFAFAEGKHIDVFLKKYPADLWLLGLRGSRTTILHMLASGQWRLAFYGRSAVLLVRQDIELPKNAPTVSPELFNPKNANSGMDSLYFACAISDFSSASSIVESMKKNFPYAPYKEHLRWASHVYDGCLAYAGGDYARVVSLLGTMKGAAGFIYVLLADSYNQLIAQVWEKGQDADALKLAIGYLQSFPDSPYANFYLAIILAQGQNFTVQDTAELPAIKELLDKFLLVTAGDKRLAVQRTQAEMLLKNQELTRGALFVPIAPPFPVKLDQKGLVVIKKVGP